MAEGLTRACTDCGDVRPIVAKGLCTKCAQRRPEVRLYQQQKRAEQARMVTDYIQDQKAGKPCSDCGAVYPPFVMDFDHRPGEPKVVALSQITRLWRGKTGLALAKVEIKKCDLVCANCHRIRTHERGQACLELQTSS